MTHRLIMMKMTSSDGHQSTLMAMDLDWRDTLSVWLRI
jgi:hypothetical protein